MTRAMLERSYLEAIDWRRTRHDRADRRDREHLPRRAPAPSDRPCQRGTQSGLLRHTSPARLPAALRPAVRRPMPPRSQGRTLPCDSRRHRRRPARSTDQRRAGLPRAAARPRRWAGGPEYELCCQIRLGRLCRPDPGQLHRFRRGWIVKIAADDDQGRPRPQRRIRGKRLDEPGHPLQFVQSSDGQDDR